MDLPEICLGLLARGVPAMSECGKAPSTGVTAFRRKNSLYDKAAHRACWKCQKPKFQKNDVNILCSTTIEILGRLVHESKGVVFGEAILGANIFRDLLAGVRGIVGGRSGAYESELGEGRNVALGAMMQEGSRWVLIQLLLLMLLTRMSDKPC